MMVAFLALFYLATPSTSTATVPLIITLVGAYFFAVLHKLNRDFFDPSRSCASQFAVEYFQDKVGQSPNQWFLCLAPYLTITIELMICGLLLVPGGLKAAAVLALILHVSLGVCGNPHFSFCVLLMFNYLLKDVHPDVITVTASCVGAVLLIAVLFARRRHARQLVLFPLIGLLGGVAGLLTAKICTEGLADSSVLLPSFVDWFAHPISSVSLVLYIANGMSPYYGKSEFSFAMFSNLRPDLDNHLFIRTAWRVSDIRRRYLRVTTFKANREVRNHPCHLVKWIVRCLDDRQNRAFNAEFIKAALAVFRSRGLLSVSVTVDTPAGSIKRLESRLSTKKMDKLLCGMTSFVANSYPPYLPVDPSVPYMG